MYEMVGALTRTDVERWPNNKII